MIKCPRYGSSNFSKNGHSHDGSQKFLCKSCHKIFQFSSSESSKYINGWVYIHNLFKDLGGDKYAIVQSLLTIITPS